MTYNDAAFACNSKCLLKDGMGRTACMRTCMNEYGYNYDGKDGGKRKTKSMKKRTNKRRKNKRTFRKRVK